MSGRSWARAEQFGTDSDGRRIPKKSPDFTGITPRPTKNHVLSHPERENPAELEQQALACARLTHEEQAIFDLQACGQVESVERSITAEEFEKHIAEGWALVRNHGGTVTMSREFVRTMTYEDMATALGLSARQVHSRVVSAHKKIKKARDGLR